MHKCYEAINAAISVPFVHIADATLSELRKHGVQKVGLLGTIYTMTQDFYKRRLIEGGVEVLVPNADEMEVVNEVIFDELCFGKILPHSKEKFLRILEGLIARGAQGVMLGGDRTARIASGYRRTAIRYYADPYRCGGKSSPGRVKLRLFCA